MLMKSRRAVLLAELRQAWPFLVAGAVFLWWITRPSEETVNEGNCDVMMYHGRLPSGSACTIQDLQVYLEQHPFEYDLDALLEKRKKVETAN